MTRYTITDTNLQSADQPEFDEYIVAYSSIQLGEASTALEDTPMSRKLTALKTEVARLRKATGADDKGTPDNFVELAIACNAEPDDRTEQEIYEVYSEDEIEWAFGRDRRRWPEWLKTKFGV